MKKVSFKDDKESNPPNVGINIGAGQDCGMSSVAQAT